MRTSCRICSPLACPVPTATTILHGAPTVVISRPSTLDSCTGRLLSSSSHAAAQHLIRTHLGPRINIIPLAACTAQNIPSHTAYHNCRAQLQFEIQLIRPIAILAIGDICRAQLIIPDKKGKIHAKYGDCIHDAQIPVIATQDLQHWTKQTHMLDVIQDLLLFNRACQMRAMELMIKCFGSDALQHSVTSILRRACNLRQLWVEKNFSTDKYREAIHS